MKQDFKKVRAKVDQIFRDLAGERAACLKGYNETGARKLRNAYRREYDAKTAWDIGFHLTDWAWDAAFIVAVQLYPEKFTAGEIRAGVMLFMIHAPSHIGAARELTGETVWTDFNRKRKSSFRRKPSPMKGTRRGR